MKEEKQRETKGAGNKLRQWARKSWFWPAAYLSAGAVLLGTYFLIQSPAGVDQAEDQEPFGDEQEWAGESGEETMPTAGGNETLQMPVMDEESVDIIGYYYDPEASAEEQQDALVYYNNMYYQNKGICIAGKDGETFEVTAAVTGEVVKAEKDEVMGYVVDLKHDNGIVTSYHSLEDLKVEEGDTVTQGSVVGMAGRSLYNSDAGIHVHFEVRKDGEPINPTDAFHQAVKELEQKDSEEESNKGSEESEQGEEANPEEEEEPSSLEEFPIFDGDEGDESEEEAGDDTAEEENQENEEE